MRTHAISPTRRSPAGRRRATVGLAFALSLVASLGAGLLGCDGEESNECSKDTECQEITCGDGTKMQSCADGVCLQGDDCKDDGDGGW